MPGRDLLEQEIAQVVSNVLQRPEFATQLADAAQRAGMASGSSKDVFDTASDLRSILVWLITVIGLSLFCMALIGSFALMRAIRARAERERLRAAVAMLAAAVGEGATLALPDLMALRRGAGMDSDYRPPSHT